MKLALFGISLLVILSSAYAKPPHILHILADDFGWAEVGYHRPGDTSGDVQTPNLDALAREGLQLDRHYVHQICSPSRSAIQTGRAPVHVNVVNVVPEVRNPKDPDAGYQGIPVNMTGIAEHLKRANYSTHIVGKWDVGMATAEHSPKSRGYDTWLGYWHHSNDYWQQTVESCGGAKMRDLWRLNGTHAGPATDLQNGPACGQGNQAPAGQTCVYEEALFTDRVKEIIRTHDADQPMFLFWSMHLVHFPLQVPQAYLDRFAHVDDGYRRHMHAMANYLDNDVGEVVQLLKDIGMWNDTLVVFHADNGGEILSPITAGNNWPLRGGKFSNWEGGIRVNAFVTGGALPASRHGTVEEGLVAGWDWYATYCALAGVDPTDHKAAAAGLPPIDSYNVWPLIAGDAQASPRPELVIGETEAYGPNSDGNARVGGLIRGQYKMLLGSPNKLYLLDQDVRTGPFWPNATSHLEPLLHTRTCGREPRHGCLFDIFADPYEFHNLAEEKPDVFADMLARIDAHEKTVFSPDRGKRDPQACVQAKKNGGYWGPFFDL